MATLGLVAALAAVVYILLHVWTQNPVWALATSGCFTVEAVAFAMVGRWDACGGCAFFAVLYFLAWLGGRRRRKRAPRQLGHKARARLAAMAAQMPKPRPVLRPVPQEATAI